MKNLFLIILLFISINCFFVNEVTKIAKPNLEYNSIEIENFKNLCKDGSIYLLEGEYVENGILKTGSIEIDFNEYSINGYKNYKTHFELRENCKHHEKMLWKMEKLKENQMIIPNQGMIANFNSISNSDKILIKIDSTLIESSFNKELLSIQISQNKNYIVFKFKNDSVITLKNDWSLNNITEKKITKNYMKVVYIPDFDKQVWEKVPIKIIQNATILIWKEETYLISLLDNNDDRFSRVQNRLIKVAKKINRTPKYEYYPLYAPALLMDIVATPVYIILSVIYLILTGGKTSLG